MNSIFVPQFAMKIRHRARESRAQFLRFLLVGASATGLQYLILIGMVEYIHIYPVTASAIAFTLSAVFNYYFSYKFTFRSTESHRSASAKYVIIALGALFMNTAIFRLAYTTIALGYIVSQVAATVVVLVFNFLMNKFWTFRA